jgi:hypothetical protein
LQLLVLVGALLLLGAQEWNLNVLPLTKTISQFGVFLTLHITLGFFLVFMALPIDKIEGLFGILLLLLEKALKPSSYV